MLRKLLVVIGLVVAIRAMGPASTAGEIQPVARWLPRDVVAVIEITEPQAIWGLLLESEVTKAVTSHPVYRQASSRPQFVQFQAVIGYLESQLGTDWKTGLKKLTGNGATLALTSQGAVVAVIDAQDAKLLNKLHGILLGFAKNEAEKQGNPDRVQSTKYQGQTCWDFGDGNIHTIVGHRYISANRLDALKAVLDVRAGSEGQSLASLPAYQEAKKAVGKATATAFVNLAAIKKHPAVEQALNKNTNPMGALLFAGLIDAVRQSNWLAMALRIDGPSLRVDMVLEGAPSAQSELAAFARPSKPTEGILPNLRVPRMIAGMSFYRDLHGFYAAKDKLFPERTSGLIFFENMMGIFFSGRDLTEEVLAETRPEVRFVVAEQQYDPKVGMPNVQIPAFALVLRVRHPKEIADLVEEAWQKAVGLVSITSGQKGTPGLVIDRPDHGDVRFTVAYYGKIGKVETDALSVRYNFRPALVKLGDYVVLSSTETLARNLIDALKKELASPPQPLRDLNSLVEVDAAQVASVLSANRAALVRQNMMEKGTTQKEAETQIDILTSVVKLLGKATLAFGEQEGRPSIRLALKLNP